MEGNGSEFLRHLFEVSSAALASCRFKFFPCVPACSCNNPKRRLKKPRIRKIRPIRGAQLFAIRCGFSQICRLADAAVPNSFLTVRQVCLLAKLDLQDPSDHQTLILISARATLLPITTANPPDKHTGKTLAHQRPQPVPIRRDAQISLPVDHPNHYSCVEKT